jgi:hypothetical protein
MDERTIRFLETVESMRNAQKDYFEKIAKAKKTKHPGDFAASSNALKESKALEIEVDRILPTLKPEANG